jgi:hypothetical protein
LGALRFFASHSACSRNIWPNGLNFAACIMLL